MTLLLAWTNKEHNPTSLNFAADSLLSDPTGKMWQHATKIFRFYPTHDYICYCGDSLLALSAIHQIIGLISCTDVLSTTGIVGSRAKAFQRNMSESIKLFPQAWGNSATILYGGFDKMLKQFKLFAMDVNKQGITCREESLSEGVKIFGSGEKAARVRLPEDSRSSAKLIRIVEAVIDDPKVSSVGGFPQMVIVTKDGSKPQAFNRTINGVPETILYGVPIQFHSPLPRVQCRDRDFKLVRSARDATVRRATSCKPDPRSKSSIPGRKY